MATTGNQNQGAYQSALPIFDGENYDFWYAKIKTIFLSYDLWDYVEDEYDELEDTTTLMNTQRQQLKDHKKKDAKALGLIQQGVADTIFPRIINASKAKEAWDILEKEYRGSTKVVNQMKTYGEDISNQRIVEKILISLPEKYDSIVAVIEETKKLENLSVEELMGSIKAFEQRLSRCSEKTIESAFQSKLNFLDSGCSNHMTGDKNIFLEIDSSSNSQVRMENGALVQANGKGTIAIETKKGRKHIRDVLLVSDLEQNLLSVGQLVEHGYSIHFDEDFCKIYDKGGQNHIVAKIKMSKNRSFPLTFSC
ncbi:uncharacterized protein LOC132269821 [Cornus florida]|uniref:uncharacterized protein LOC132269821 n=1 Tax=Cornus florida TaxID=4283 RepID=UPI00289CAF81|nr:uncharacterized protein LOC132269821 [Cornus florida]